MSTIDGQQDQQVAPPADLLDPDGPPQEAAPPRRRRTSRRAASRPAGPPVPAADEVVPDPVSGDPVASAPGGSDAGGSDAGSSVPDSTAPDSTAPDSTALDRSAPDSADVVSSEPVEAVDVAPEAPTRRSRRQVVSPVFQAPDLTPAPRRHRAASRPAGPPEHREPEAQEARAEVEPAAAPVPVVTTSATGLAHGPDDSLDAVDADEVGALDRQEVPAATSGEVAEAEHLLGADAEDPADPEDTGDVEDSDDTTDDTTDDTADDTADDTDDAPGRRPRRRRGGRGRRRRTAEGDDAGGDSDAADDVTEASLDASAQAPQALAAAGAPAEVDAAPPAAADDDDESPSSTEAETETENGDDAEDAGGSRRRRRRRRSRAGGEPEADEPAGESGEGEVPSARSRSRARRAVEAADDVTAVRGSTRLEAKRQRRRDGRDGGRRRQSITEAEFLARRESVERTMVVRSSAGRTQVAVLEDGVLVEHYVARKQHTSMIGNVHLGRVQNVLPSMEAAFVDIGRGRNAVLYAGEVDWDAAGLTGQAKRIESALKPGDSVLVQVTKDPIGHKGSRLTSQISLPGRYLVYVPNGSMTGISRKLPDPERARLKTILKAVVPEHAGVIVRTASEGASEEELRRDVERLAAQWEEISARAKQVSPPTLLHGEPDLVVKVVRDVFNEDFASLVVVGDEAWETVKGYVDAVAPDLSARVTRWEGPDDAFAAYRIDEQIAKALERKVWLPSGGSLVIDRTEAMTVVDVNTGRFTGAGGNLEETVTKNNLEAAEEIVRQLRLRDIGGIIVVDFIDMVLESNRELVLRRLVECLGRDRTKHQVAEVTSLGLVQMTRKRVGQGLIEAFSEQCEHCAGRGVVVQPELLVVPGASGGPRVQPAPPVPPAPLAPAEHVDHAPTQAPSHPHSHSPADHAERSREDVARDAVREAIREVAQASRLHGQRTETHADGPGAGAGGEASPQDRVEAARQVAELVGDALAAHAAQVEASADDSGDGAGGSDGAGEADPLVALVPGDGRLHGTEDDPR